MRLHNRTVKCAYSGHLPHAFNQLQLKHAADFQNRQIPATVR